MILPFSRTEFLEVFAAYNTAIWPFQFVAALLGLFAIALLYWRMAWAGRAIAGVLTVFWLVTGIGYHWLHFAAINKAANSFGTLFVLQALVFLIEGVIRGRMKFVFGNDFRDWLAVLSFVYAFAVYPLLGLFITDPWPGTPLFGVAPCPTTIFTLAFLMLLRHPHPWSVAAIPLFWSIVGGSAAILLDVPQDLGLLAAALLWVGGALLPRKSVNASVA